MLETISYNDLTIELFDDAAFKQSADSPTSYGKVIQADKDKAYSPTSQHAIKIYRDGCLINSAIVLASGGATGVSSDTALIDGNNLVIRCCNKLFSLALPSLETNWMAEPDWATCFSVHQYEDSYIVHGETSITRIDQWGKILWSREGADIFVCLYEGIPFDMCDTYIALTDFNGATYRLDYDGHFLDEREPDTGNQASLAALHAPKKPWWKFW